MDEAKRRPLPDYIEMAQKDVSPNMKAILVDWLVEVAEEYELHSDTLHLSISYIDRFLSTNDLNRWKLQLLGVSSMLIASKYEEINHPPVDEFCYLTNNAYTKKEVVKMEADILKHLKFEVGDPTIMTFLGKVTVVAQEDYQAQLSLLFSPAYFKMFSIRIYILILPNKDFLVAASVVFLSWFTIQPKLHPWSSTLQDFSSYIPANLKECVLIIHDLQLSKRGGSLVASRNKYKQDEFKCVSTLSSPQEITNSFFKDVKDS
ncbi:Cyclin-A3-4 [Camellia lanceoleosa]|nr:Cyclin-A3-4 [Camellia lanceoleosa]